MPGPDQNLLRRAMTAHRAGDFAAAERLYSKLLRRAPGEFNALHMLGVMRAQEQRFTEAERLIAKALDRHVSAEALNNYGSVLTELGRHAEAIVRLQRALLMKPDYADAHFNLGNALSKGGRLADAEKSYAAAIGIKPGYIKAYQSLSALLCQVNRAHEAISVLRRAIVISPDSGQLYFKLAVLLRDLGQIEESREMFEQAIARDPEIPDAYYNLVYMRKVRPDDPLLALTEALVQRAGTFSPSGRAVLNFALGKAYGDVGRYDESFAAFLEANRLTRSSIKFDECEVRQQFADLQASFTSDLLAEREGSGCQSDLPIFILGFPRSGTTLTEQILASHPQVHGAGELDFVAELTVAPPLVRAPGFGFPQSLRLLGAEYLRDLGATYVERLRAFEPKAPHITDKGLKNFMLLGFIRLILPKAKIIHVRRDAVDTCLSCFFLKFAENNLAFAYDLGELGRHYRRYLDLMDHWHRILPQGSMIDVQYESLVGNLETEARRILGYCGLPWDQRCLDFHRTERAVRTASTGQIRQPIYRSSMQRWRRYERHLGPLLEALDLPAAPPQPSMADEATPC